MVSLGRKNWQIGSSAESFPAAKTYFVTTLTGGTEALLHKVGRKLQTGLQQQGPASGCRQAL